MSITAIVTRGFRAAVAEVPVRGYATTPVAPALGATRKGLLLSGSGMATLWAGKPVSLR